MLHYSNNALPSSKAAILVVLLLSLTSVVVADTLPSSLAFEKPVPFVCDSKTYFLQDEETYGCAIQGESPEKLVSSKNIIDSSLMVVQRGGAFGLSKLIPAGYNPFGYQITELGQTFLEFDGSLDSDVGRFLASVKTRKRFEAIKSQWLEILRVSKKGQSMRIYRKLDDLVAFCVKAGLLD